jgi:hypothetical protein
VNWIKTLDRFAHNVREKFRASRPFQKSLFGADVDDLHAAVEDVTVSYKGFIYRHEPCFASVSQRAAKSFAILVRRASCSDPFEYVVGAEKACPAAGIRRPRIGLPSGRAFARISAADRLPEGE